MKPSNLELLNRSFTIQAPNFESSRLQFSKKEYLQYMTAEAAPAPTDTILEVASGTCLCGRAFAPCVRTVVCVDATASMLEEGKREAEKVQLENLCFVKGYAEELPFLDNSFDLVFSRLAFHHFTDVSRAFSEMVRVLKPGGKLLLVDMAAAEETLRTTEDQLETLRDPSHVKNLSLAEMKGLFESHKLVIEKCQNTKILQRLNDWMHLTNTPAPAKETITARMEAELNGKDKTGFSPFRTEDSICFYQNWILILGRK